MLPFSDSGRFAKHSACQVFPSTAPSSSTLCTGTYLRHDIFDYVGVSTSSLQLGTISKHLPTRPRSSIT